MCCSWTSCTRGIFHKFAPGWSEQDGQGDGQNGWSRRVSRQSKPKYQDPRTLFSVLRPFRLILVGLGSDRIVLSFVFIFQVIIYFTIFLSFKCKYIHQSIRNLSLYFSQVVLFNNTGQALPNKKLNIIFNFSIPRKKEKNFAILGRIWIGVFTKGIRVSG